MGKMVLLDTRVYVSGLDLSGYSNKVEVSEKFDDRKITNFRSGGAVELLGGLAEVEIGGEGQFSEGDAMSPGDSFWANRRVIEPWSLAADALSDLSVGSHMYLTTALRTDISIGGGVGDVHEWSASAKGSQALVRGKVLHPSGVARTATGTGTVVDMLVGPSASQSVFANLHVVSIAGTAPTLTVAIQSATTLGFGSPTTRGTFTVANSVSGQSLKIASPGTDRYWRVSYTITGTGSPSFLFLTSLGIE